ncbi:MAG: hypothetical protein KBD00_03000 [Candidatus Peribacteraceae bacterium]|nr:hypothetical protein [Candidatus Peribacteraceae bacterium]
MQERLEPSVISALEDVANDKIEGFSEMLEASIAAFRIVSIADQSRVECRSAIPGAKNAQIDSFVALKTLGVLQSTLSKLVGEEIQSANADQDSQRDDLQESIQNLKLGTRPSRSMPITEIEIDDETIRESSEDYLRKQRKLDKRIGQEGALNGNVTDEDVHKAFEKDLGYTEKFERGPRPLEVFRDNVIGICRDIIAACDNDTRLETVLAAGIATRASVNSLIENIWSLADKLPAPSDEE